MSVLVLQHVPHALGARVYPNVRDGKPVKEIRYCTVRLTEDGTAHPLFKGFEADLRVLPPGGHAGAGARARGDHSGVGAREL